MLGCNKMTIYIDKISIISLDLPATINFHLNKAQFLNKNLIIILSKLFIIIFLSNFFQFLSITRQFL